MLSSVTTDQHQFDVVAAVRLFDAREAATASDGSRMMIAAGRAWPRCRVAATAGLPDAPPPRQTQGPVLREALFVGAFPRETARNGCFGDKPEVVMCCCASDGQPREGERVWCRWWRQCPSGAVLCLRQPPARLLAMIWPNIAAKAKSLITSFS
jgi:hypothetical protein